MGENCQARPHVQVPKAYSRFDFDHVEPAGVLASVVELGGDPVVSGIVEGLDRPGGNITRFANLESLAGRQVA